MRGLLNALAKPLRHVAPPCIPAGFPRGRFLAAPRSCGVVPCGSVQPRSGRSLLSIAELLGSCPGASEAQTSSLRGRLGSRKGCIDSHSTETRSNALTWAGLQSTWGSLRKCGPKYVNAFHLRWLPYYSTALLWPEQPLKTDTIYSTLYASYQALIFSPATDRLHFAVCFILSQETVLHALSDCTLSLVVLGWLWKNQRTHCRAWFRAACKLTLYPSYPHALVLFKARAIDVHIFGYLHAWKGAGAWFQRKQNRGYLRFLATIQAKLQNYLRDG